MAATDVHTILTKKPWGYCKRLAEKGKTQALRSGVKKQAMAGLTGAEK